MTVNEAIAALQALSAAGHGDLPVVGWGLDAWGQGDGYGTLEPPYVTRERIDFEADARDVVVLTPDGASK